MKTTYKNLTSEEKDFDILSDLISGYYHECQELIIKKSPENIEIKLIDFKEPNDNNERETFIYLVSCVDDLYITLATCFSDLKFNTYYTTWFENDGKIQLPSENYEKLLNLIYVYQKEIKKLEEEICTLRTEQDVLNFFNKVFTGEYQLIFYFENYINYKYKNKEIKLAIMDNAFKFIKEALSAIETEYIFATNDELLLSIKPFFRKNKISNILKVNNCNIY